MQCRRFPSEAGNSGAAVSLLTMQGFFTPSLFIVCVEAGNPTSCVQHNEDDGILWGESSCLRGPSEPTYCVFAEAAMEQNAALGSVSYTSQEQDDALHC